MDTGHQGPIHIAQLDHFGRYLATGSEDAVVKVWSLLDVDESRHITDLVGHADSVLGLSWSHPKFGPLLASCGADCKVLVWRGPPLEEQKETGSNWCLVHVHEVGSEALGISFSPWEYGIQLAVARFDGRVSVWSLIDDPRIRASQQKQVIVWNRHATGDGAESLAEAPSVSTFHAVKDDVPDRASGARDETSRNPFLDDPQQASDAPHSATAQGQEEEDRKKEGTQEEGAADLGKDDAAAEPEPQEEPAPSPGEGEEEDEDEDDLVTPRADEDDDDSDYSHDYYHDYYSDYGDDDRYIRYSNSLTEPDLDLRPDFDRDGNGAAGQDQATPAPASDVGGDKSEPSGEDQAGKKKIWHNESFFAHNGGCLCLCWAAATVAEESNGKSKSRSSKGKTEDPLVQPRRLVTGGADKKVRIWRHDVKTHSWADQHRFGSASHKAMVRDVAWRPNVGIPTNTIASCSEDGVVMIWSQLMAGKPWEVKATFAIGKGVLEVAAWQVSWSITGSILAISTSDSEVELYKEQLDGNWESVNLVNEDEEDEEEEGEDAGANAHKYGYENAEQGSQGEDGEEAKDKSKSKGKGKGKGKGKEGEEGETLQLSRTRSKDRANPPESMPGLQL